MSKYLVTNKKDSAFWKELKINLPAGVGKIKSKINTIQINEDGLFIKFLKYSSFYSNFF